VDWRLYSSFLLYHLTMLTWKE